MTQSFVKSPQNETTTVSSPFYTTSDIILENVNTIMWVKLTHVQCLVEYPDFKI